VNALALVLNENLRKLGCLEWWWLGVFIALNHQQVVGGGYCRWAPPDTVRCASHVTQPLGFGSYRLLETLSSSGIGQSVCRTGHALFSVRRALTLRSASHCSACRESLQSTVALNSCYSAGAPDSLVAHRTVR
jgi:hypothetical protein